LTNVRCLGEGVDVPSLDAVLFLSPRNSQVDVVQSVGRVMRTASGKKYGYIIIPVVIPPDCDAEDVMDKSDRFKVVWSVLNALRAHDDRFEATVNKIELNKHKPGQILIGGISGGSGDDGGWEYSNRSSSSEGNVVQLEFQFEQLSSTFYARMVQKVGDKRYWEQWAGDVALIAKRHIDRIERLIAEDGKPKREFEKFMKGLHRNINPSLTQDDAIEMLSQHIITKPVFEALFDDYAFVKSNPISRSMQKVLDLIEEQAPAEENEKLEAFYDSVRRRARGIDNAEAKQKVIVELYDKFFKVAFPKVVEKLGIVYTPVEVVDYIIKSVAWILKQEFGRDISDENIHILDPFTGTGTFITRLLQSGLINPEALERKYTEEIHANEIVLLAYYIASINIENVYHDIIGEENGYKAFEGICLTDTFQMSEKGDMGTDVFPYNSRRVAEQKKRKITICIGNPPYSVGQKSANDNAQNRHYPILDGAIERTYAKYSVANNKNSLYDSYIKAFRWATDRIGDKGGIIGFISNGSWIDGNAQDGMRKCFEREFSKIYVFNLRGNQRTSGELSRKEGGKIFGSGSRTPISITILVKKEKKSDKPAEIYYRDIGDYLSREEKLRTIRSLGSIGNPSMDWKRLQPNQQGDWINHRSEAFASFIKLGDKDEKDNQISRNTFFERWYSNGLKTQRDSWAYNSSLKKLRYSARTQIDFYNEQAALLTEGSIGDVDYDTCNIAWTSAVLNDIHNGRKYRFGDVSYRIASYRPFFRQHLLYYKPLNERTYQIPRLFPTGDVKNLVICVSGVGLQKPFSCLMTDTTPDLEYVGKSQCFPLYWYEEDCSDTGDLFSQTLDDGSRKDKYIRHDCITDWILRQCRNRYGNKITKEDIFYYVYGILHSPEYRTAFEADLRKMLPRLPLVDTPSEFEAFSSAGRTLATLHLNYETAKPYQDVTIQKKTERSIYKVEKMRFAKLDSKTPDKSKIIYNSTVTIEDIPPQAYDYVVNGKSAIEWVMERYQVTTDPKSGITNDPNDWSTEHGDEQYIFNLLLKIITISIETRKVVSTLPKLNLE